MTRERPSAEPGLPERGLTDILAALSHDLRSTLSGASLTAGMMGMHGDAEVRGFSERLNRMVSKQTTLLDLAYDLARIYESDALDRSDGASKNELSDDGDGLRNLELSVEDLAAMLRNADVSVSGEEAKSQVKLPLGRPVGRALCMLLSGGDALFELHEGRVAVRTTVPMTSGETRSVPLVALAACGVTREVSEGATRFFLG